MITGKTMTWRDMILKWQKDPKTLFDIILRHVLEVGIELDSGYIIFRNTSKGEFGFKGIPQSSEKKV